MTTPTSAIAAETQTKAAVAHRSRSGTFDALANRDFRYLLGGTMAANAAMWVQMIA